MPPKAKAKYASVHVEKLQAQLTTRQDAPNQIGVNGTNWLLLHQNEETDGPDSEPDEV